MDGTPGANSDVSETSTTSAARRSVWARSHAGRWALPFSSSPSIIILRLTGRASSDFRYASAALTCMNAWPLSSAEPRATRLPSLTMGSKGSWSQSSSGSGGCTS